MSRTFKVQFPHMQGSDVRAWQDFLNRQMRAWNVDYRIPENGDYSVSTRDLTATVLYGLGIDRDRMGQGVTPTLRVKVRNKRLSPVELARHAARAGWRRRLRKRHQKRSVAPPLNRILSSSWGWTPPVHDGVDLICDANATIYALCDAEVIDVRSSGWWGNNPSGDVSKGDGIIQIRCLTDQGPFRRGLHFGYGHAEHAVVKVGDRVRAGEPLGKAGFAVAWHVHFMCNGGGTTKGVGDRDPMPYVRYASKRR